MARPISAVSICSLNVSRLAISWGPDTAVAEIVGRCSRCGAFMALSSRPLDTCSAQDWDVNSRMDVERAPAALGCVSCTAVLMRALGTVVQVY